MIKNKEIWKDIEDYKGLYQVSNLGRVKSLNYKRTGKEKILKNSKNSDGYFIVNLCKNGEQKYYKVHRLVAQSFIPNPKNLPIINHKSEDKTDNRFENLEWCTNQYNVEYSLAKPILQFDKKMNYIKKWSSAREIQRELGFKNENISSCCRGKIKSAYRYKWGFENEYERIPFKVFNLEMYRKKVS